MKKFSAIILALIFLTSMAASEQWTFQGFSNAELTYGDGSLTIDETSNTPTIYCNGADCPESDSGEFPGATATLLKLSRCDAYLGLEEKGHSSYDHVYMGVNDASAPGVYSCSQGPHTPYLVDNDDNVLFEASSKSILVSGSKSKDHRGKSLRVIANDKKANLRSFFLSGNCEEISKCNANDPANQILEMVIHEKDTDFTDGPDDDRLVAEARTPSSSNSPLIANETTPLLELHGKTRETNEGDNSCSDDGNRNTHDACDLLQNFKEMDMKLDDPSSANGKYPDGTTIATNDYTPVHNGSAFMPNGEIIVGRIPEHYTENGNRRGGNLYFFICRPGATISNGYGGETEQVVRIGYTSDGGPKLFDCNTQSGEWGRTYECEDGLDNDGKKGIDESTDCDDTGTDNNEAVDDSDCPTSAVGKASDGLISLTRDFSKQGCEYNAVERFTDFSTSDSNIQSKPFYSNAGKSPDRFTCTESTTGSFSDASRNSLCDKASYNGHSGSVPAVEYYPTKEYLKQQGREWHGGSIEVGDAWESEFVSTGGAFRSRYQTLHQAEKKYDSGSSATSCESCHDNETWIDKAVQNAADYSYGSYMDSWNVSAPGESFASNSIETGAGFSGGFVPYCKEGLSWSQQVSGEWICSVGDGQASMSVQFFKTRGNLSGQHVGFKIPAAEASAIKVAYGSRGGIAETNDYNQFRVQTQCFLGKYGVNRPDQASEYFNATKNVQTQGPTYITAELPYRDFSSADDQSLASYTDYTCVFGFVKSSKGNLIDPNDPNGGIVPSITEGRSGLHSIDVTAETVSPAVDLKQRTTGVTTGNDIWTLFSKGTSGPDDPINHPGIWYDQKN